VTILLTKIRRESHLLAISKDNGKHWYFMDTANLLRDNVKSILPHYNMELKIPAKEQPVRIEE
jgi:hypothetical protein